MQVTENKVNFPANDSPTTARISARLNRLLAEEIRRRTVGRKKPSQGELLEEAWDKASLADDEQYTTAITIGRGLLELLNSKRDAEHKESGYEPTYDEIIRDAFADADAASDPGRISNLTKPGSDVPDDLVPVVEFVVDLLRNPSVEWKRELKTHLIGHAQAHQALKTKNKKSD